MTDHSDVRILRLMPLLDDMEVNLTNIMAQQIGPNQDPAIRLLNSIDHLKSLLALCRPSVESKAYYMNAWTYHYLKKRVLTITNPDDYQYLDHLLVVDASVRECGSFYIQAIADVEKMEAWRDPALFYPGEAPAKISLFEFICSKSDWHEGHSVVRLEGSLTIQIAEVYERGAKVIISDAGLCGSTPHTLTVTLHWRRVSECE